MKIKRLHHLQLCVSPAEEEHARKFYIQELGFEEIPKPPALLKNGGFWCRAGEIELHIGLEETDGTKSKRHPAFEVEDLEGARDFLTKLSVEMKEESQIPGVKRFSFYDPFGNRIELLELN
ncbi:VOC family protein [Metabacillus indicus]|uniref:VOC family protein n=1 Tax=Metabacillus indicus TaxID=246786 RepID=UPI002A02E744|nr:VOC family protein [Metabacillus indicus]MDX8291327.1 VOC family protein [Metabacillus indicus]